jgi:hypothetical protein
LSANPAEKVHKKLHSKEAAKVPGHRVTAVNLSYAWEKGQEMRKGQVEEKV